MTPQGFKSIIIGLLAILVLGLLFFGYEVKRLRTEVRQLSAASPAVMRSQQWRMDPYAGLTQLQRQMNQLFDNTLWSGPQRGFSTGSVYQLSTDIKDNKDKYVISMDIPGMEKQNINVEVKNNNLMVSGERNAGQEEKNANYYSQERSFGYFSEVFPLPSDANAAAISVQYDKGVLKIEIPKVAKAITQQQEQATTIKVN